MSLKISSLLLLCSFAVLLVAFLGQSSDGATYADFARQHIEPSGPGNSNPNAYCNRMMRQRGMTTGACKTYNTFIHSDPDSIQNICCRHWICTSGNFYNSRQRFRVTACFNIGLYPNCNYVGTRMTKKICVACVNGLPVHFEKFL
ncbi:ribonuclease pancreatic-like isoform X2 [Sphaerodactylus townsendi]|uniref:ribonuclease pancreatic-like isoform X2 n=1 Tax=Sphaerodactylus townsendi TaxID=933632 RepID=UPI002025EC89|nr:ribonuclease pancreatic-like isoform X2 [Sphaerodactylus townsendi]XP_048374333.1 ribonuclease pancreatic-like isoform X2 [Sphaerodactylus townsendi]